MSQADTAITRAVPEGEAHEPSLPDLSDSAAEAAADPIGAACGDDADGAIARAFLTATMNAVKDAVVGLSPDARRILFWNTGAEQLFGYPADAMLGQPFGVLVPEEERPAYEENLRRILNGETDRMRMEAERQHRNGARIEVSEATTPVRRADGARVGVCVAARESAPFGVLPAERDAAIERQSRTAELIQRALLAPPRPESLRGMEVHTFYDAASQEAELGGDWFAAFALDDGRLCFGVGDNTGKGVGAALHTAEIKAALKAFTRQTGGDVVATLRELNRFVADSQRLDTGRADTYVCLSLAVVTPTTGGLVIAVAGAEAPLVARADGTVDTVAASGPILGALDTWDEPAATMHLAAQDVLMLYTDGLTDARSRGPSGGVFGPEGVVQAVTEAASSGDLSEIATTVVTAARRFAGEALNDDVCVLLARRGAD